MFDVKLYKPGSSFVNQHNKPHMGALVFSFVQQQQIYECPLWLAQDDLPKVRDRAWLCRQACKAFYEAVSHFMPEDIVCIQPVIEDELEGDDESLDFE